MLKNFNAAFLTAVAALFMAGSASAAFVGDPAAKQGGFTGPSSADEVMTVAEAKRQIASDDRLVTLEGYIVGQVKKDEYRFKDDSGECIVDIDDEDFRGQQVDPKTKMRLVIELDSFYAGEFDVKRLDLVK